MAKLKDKILAMDNTIAQEMLLSGGRHIAAYVLTNSLKKNWRSRTGGGCPASPSKGGEKRISILYTLVPPPKALTISIIAPQNGQWYNKIQKKVFLFR